MDPWAQRTLGRWYRSGRGLPRDDHQAHFWLSLAAENLPSGEDRAAAIAERDALASLLPEYQRSEAQKLVREWKPKQM